MKRFNWGRVAPMAAVFGLLFSLLIAMHPMSVAADASNLINNPSAETADSVGGVLNWTPNTWGTSDTTLGTTSDAHSGNQALTITTNSRSSGDAKWIPDAVAITGGSKYNFSDYYKASVTTEIDAAYYDASGNVSYYYIMGVQPSANTWAQAVTTFTAPANAVKVSLMHILVTPGTLTTDDYSLTPYQLPVPTGSNLVPNPSLETANGATPAGWQNSSWGSNSTTFSYVDDAHTGTKSVKTEITSYTDGDAKWFFSPITTLTSGKTYTFSTWLKSTTQASAVVAYDMTDGSIQYVTLPAVPAPSTDWQQYSTNFDVPLNVKDATVYMLISSVGWIETDDYSLTPYVPVGFSEGLVSLTYDDGWTSTFKNGNPLMQKYGFKGTYFIISGYIGAPLYMNKSQITTLKNEGNEIGSHSVDHPDLTTLSSSQLTTELTQSQKTLRADFGQGYAQNFATPYGAYNDNVLTQVMKYYRSQRGVDAGFNSKDNFNIRNILVQNVDWDTTNAQVQAWVDQAKADHTWLVLVYHQVETTQTKGDIYAVKTANLDAQLNYIKSTGITVKTLNKALNEITPQL